MRRGCLIISLDFELMWGMIDIASKDKYGKSNVSNVPTVIEGMIRLFDKYEVHATFATVGMIMLPGKDTLLKHIPTILPQYKKTALSPYQNNYIEMISKAEERLFFLPGIVKMISNHSEMEVATHTFCHYYCAAEGQSIVEFEEDLKKAVDVASSMGIRLQSIVFPRNEVSEDYVKVCSKYGIIAYRGNARKFFDSKKSPILRIIYRFLRLIDAYLNIGGNMSTPYCNIDPTERPINIPASRMIRPYSSLLSFLDGARLNRIKTEIRLAAINGDVYHIWWHPHNFGANINENLSFLEEILKAFDKCREEYGMQSFSMGEFAEKIINEKDNG